MTEIQLIRITSYSLISAHFSNTNYNIIFHILLFVRSVVISHWNIPLKLD